MTIQRQYSLPNCTLKLEGLGDLAVSNTSETRPLMSILVNAECQITGQDTPLTGGRDFFESFITAVSLYTQEVLSGIQTLATQANSRLVQLRRLDANHHRLTILPEGAEPGSGIAAQLTREVDLTTVQLFDLVEAIDQFFADSQTLPELGLKIEPLSKRHLRSAEPVAKRAIPVTIGASSVALATAALFFVPVPQVRQPEDLVPKPGAATSGASPTTPASPAGASPNPSSAQANNLTSPSPSPAGEPDLARLEAALTAPEITDAAQLEGLGKKLYTQIDQAWKDRTPFVQDLVYRVGVAKDGAIVGYKPINPAALTYAKQTPLLNLLYLPTGGSQPGTEPIAQYKVVFTSSGVLEVAPWQQVMVTPTNQVSEITDVEKLKELQPRLYDQIDQAWKSTPEFKEDLVFRVRVKQDGTIADYKPENKAAIDSAEKVPISQLGKPVTDGDSGGSQEPLALFKVVFKPDGKLEVSPWRGRRE